MESQIKKGKDFPNHMMGKFHKEMRECSNVENHIYGPEGYNQWHGWTQEIKKTHRQKMCICGFWVLWIEK